MGYSWALTAKVVVPEAQLAAYREHTVTSAELRGAPRPWGNANAREPMTVLAIVEALRAEELVEVTWTDAGLRLAGVLSNDSSTWADLRTHVVAAVRAAASVGGGGDIAIAGWLDGAPEIAFVASGGHFDALEGAEAKAVEQRVHAEVGPIVERFLEASAPSGLTLAEPIAALHRELVAALRKFSPERVFEAVAKRTEPWPSPKSMGALVPLAQSFASPRELLDALASGWKNLYDPGSVPAVVLELLTELDHDTAATLSRRVLSVSPLPPALRAAAESVSVRTDTDAAVIAALELLRTSIRPKELHVHGHPIVRRLRDASRERVLPIVRRFLADLVAAPLDDQAAAAARALTFLLRDIGTDEDLPLLLPLWIGYGHPQLAAFDLAWQRGGDRAKKLFADMFGANRATIDYGHVRQGYALRALTELDPERLFAKVRELMAEPALTREQAHAIEAVNEAAGVPGSPWSPGWASALRAIAERHAGYPWGNNASAVLALHREPDGVEWALGQLKKGENVDWMARVLESSGNREVVPRLRELLSTLDRKGKTRLEKCIAKLEGTASETPAGHHVGIAPSARAACRACKEKIAKGELRFGESVANTFSSSGEPTHRWYHLRCAAEKKPALLGPALAAYAGEVPDREALVAAIQAKAKKKKK
jgi:hypothetical protein